MRTVGAMLGVDMNSIIRSAITVGMTIVIDNAMQSPTAVAGRVRSVQASNVMAQVVVVAQAAGIAEDDTPLGVAMKNLRETVNNKSSDMATVKSCFDSFSTVVANQGSTGQVVSDKMQALGAAITELAKLCSEVSENAVDQRQQLAKTENAIGQLKITMTGNAAVERKLDQAISAIRSGLNKVEKADIIAKADVRLPFTTILGDLTVIAEGSSATPENKQSIIETIAKLQTAVADNEKTKNYTAAIQVADALETLLIDANLEGECRVAMTQLAVKLEQAAGKLTLTQVIEKFETIIQNIEAVQGKAESAALNDQLEDIKMLIAKGDIGLAARVFTELKDGLSEVVKTSVQLEAVNAAAAGEAKQSAAAPLAAMEMEIVMIGNAFSRAAEFIRAITPIKVEAVKKEETATVKAENAMLFKSMLGAVSEVRTALAELESKLDRNDPAQLGMANKVNELHTIADELSKVAVLLSNMTIDESVNTANFKANLARAAELIVQAQGLVAANSSMDVLSARLDEIGRHILHACLDVIDEIVSRNSETLGNDFAVMKARLDNLREDNQSMVLRDMPVMLRTIANQLPAIVAREAKGEFETADTGALREMLGLETVGAGVGTPTASAARVGAAATPRLSAGADNKSLTDKGTKESRKPVVTGTHTSSTIEQNKLVKRENIRQVKEEKKELIVAIGKNVVLDNRAVAALKAINANIVYINDDASNESIGEELKVSCKTGNADYFIILNSE